MLGIGRIERDMATEFKGVFTGGGQRPRKDKGGSVCASHECCRHVKDDEKRLERRDRLRKRQGLADIASRDASPEERVLALDVAGIPCGEKEFVEPIVQLVVERYPEEVFQLYKRAEQANRHDITEILEEMVEELIRHKVMHRSALRRLTAH